MNYSAAPIWEDCPHTSEIAKPKATHQVHNAAVIEVKNAQYRRAEFSGTFLIADKTNQNLIEGKQRVEVYCCWFGHRLKTRGIKILVDNTNSNAIIKNNYSGLVVCDIAK
jgi:hypothetical protein